MKKLILLMAFCFSFLSLWGQDNVQYKSVDVDEFAEFIKNPNVILLDVRSAAEHAEGHIPGTKYNINVLEDTFTDIALEKLSKESPIALYCRSGNRSKTAAKILSSKGYQVIELSTGYKGWAAAKQNEDK